VVDKTIEEMYHQLAYLILQIHQCLNCLGLGLTPIK